MPVGGNNMIDDTLLSTKQALKVLSKKYPGFVSGPQLMGQVRKGKLRIAAIHGRKYFFTLEDVMNFVPAYEGQGRNKRPPTWSNQGFTLTEAAKLLGVTRDTLVGMQKAGTLHCEQYAGVYSVSAKEIERLKETK